MPPEDAPLIHHAIHVPQFIGHRAINRRLRLRRTLVSFTTPGTLTTSSTAVVTIADHLDRRRPGGADLLGLGKQDLVGGGGADLARRCDADLTGLTPDEGESRDE